MVISWSLTNGHDDLSWFHVFFWEAEDFHGNQETGWCHGNLMTKNVFVSLV
jgi:hypothetical protein